MHVYAHAFPKVACACLMHTYAYTGLHTHAKVIKGKFFSIKCEVWNESHIVWEPFQTPIFQLYKALHGIFQKHTENPKGNLRLMK